MLHFFVNSKTTLNDESYYESKWIALEAFYSYVDQGDDYELAMERFLYDIHPSSDLDEMVMVLTLVSRFQRLQYDLPKCIVPEAHKAVKLYIKHNKNFRHLGKYEAADLETDFIATKNVLQK